MGDPENQAVARLSQSDPTRGNGPGQPTAVCQINARRPETFERAKYRVGGVADGFADRLDRPHKGGASGTQQVVKRTLSAAGSELQGSQEETLETGQHVRPTMQQACLRYSHGTLGPEQYGSVIHLRLPEQKMLAIQEIKKIFNQFDTNNSGTICRSELSKLAVALNNTLNNADLANWMRAIDTDCSGNISFAEFIHYWEK